MFAPTVWDPRLAQRSAEAPAARLQLDRAWGCYAGKDSRSPVVSVLPGGSEVVYFVAAAAVVLDTERAQQRFFLGHDDDILSLAGTETKISYFTLAFHPLSTRVFSALTRKPFTYSFSSPPHPTHPVHPRGHVAATGQAGHTPVVCIWRTERPARHAADIPTANRALRSLDLGDSIGGLFGAESATPSQEEVRRLQHRAGESGIIALSFGGREVRLFPPCFLPFFCADTNACSSDRFLLPYEGNRT